jgi:uncharacterized membrane protein YqhA
MLRSLLASSRYVVLVAVFGASLAAIALMIYESIAIVVIVVDTINAHSISPAVAKTFAVGIIEAIDVYLIAIAIHIIGLGLFTLFIDDTLPLPRWLKIRDLEDLKSNLVSVIIAVLAVLFLREAVADVDGHELLLYGAALAIVIASLTLFLGKISRPRE